MNQRNQIRAVAAENLFDERPLARAPVWVFALIERSAVYVAKRHGVAPERVLTVGRSHVYPNVAAAREELAARVYNAFPHRAMLARAMGIPRDTLRDWLRRAEGNGLVRRSCDDEAAA
jgi:hypothetical protein